MTANPRPIFLSHAAADKALVEAFENLLARSIGLTADDVFCSSLEGQGVRKGQNFVDSIRGQIVGAKAVVALITPAYLDSAFCMAELGAAWALNTERFPIVVPPNSFEVMNATLLGIVGVQLDDETALSQMFEDICTAIDLKCPAIAVRSRAMRNFNREWDKLKNEIQGSRRIEAEVHKKALSELNDAVKARDDAERDLEAAEAQIKALEKVKEATEVSKIAKQFSKTTWEEEFDEITSDLRDLEAEVGGKEIARLLILDRLGKERRPDANAYPDEVDRAIELDVYDHENMKWNYGHPDVKKVFAVVDRMLELFSENPEIEGILKKRDEKSDPNTIRFWESHL